MKLYWGDEASDRVPPGEVDAGRTNMKLKSNKSLWQDGKIFEEKGRIPAKVCWQRIICWREVCELELHWTDKLHVMKHSNLHHLHTFEIHTSENHKKTCQSVNVLGTHLKEKKGILGVRLTQGHLIAGHGLQFWGKGVLNSNRWCCCCWELWRLWQRMQQWWSQQELLKAGGMNQWLIYKDKDKDIELTWG